MIALPRLCAAIVASAAVVPAFGASWTFAPRAYSSVDHESNRGLVPGRGASEAIFLQGGVRLWRRTQSTDVALSADAGGRRSNDDDIGRTEAASVLLTGAAVRERTVWNASLRYAYDGVLDDAFDASGLVAGRDERWLGSASLSWSWQQSERWRTFAQASFDDVEFRSERAGRLTDYRYPFLAIGQTFIGSPRTSWSFSAFTSRIDSEDERLDTRDNGVRVELSHQLTESLLAGGYFGYSRQTSDFAQSDGLIASARIERKSPRATWRAEIRHRNAPTSLGRLVRRDEAEASVVYALLPRTSLTIGARYLGNEDIGFGGVASEWRHYAALEGALSFRATASTSLGVQVRGEQGERLGDSRTVDGARVAISVAWNPSPSAVRAPW